MIRVPAESAITDVAAAVIVRPDGSFLLAQRPAGKVYAGYWEFPGGKLEPGEPAERALARELHEELGIEVERAHPWITRVYAYAHATVRLHFFRVVAWHGEPHGREDQQLAWQAPARECVAPMLPANAPVLKALALPAVYAISNASELGVRGFLERARAALAGGLKLLQLREKQMAPAALEALGTQLVALARCYGAAVLVNADASLARRIGAQGVHLTAAQLARCEVRPDFEWCAASCHDAAELQRAAALDLDFVLLGPVQPTPTHPGHPGLGWPAFVALVRDYPLPVYALGGMQPRDIEQAWRCGAHGIGMQRAAWR